MTDEEFLQVMTFLSASYPRHQLTDETLEAYRAIVGDLDVALFRAAALQIASRDSPWFPSAGQLRQAAFRLLEREAGVPDAGTAWGEVCKLIREVGHWGVPEYSHPLIGAAVDGIGGWADLCKNDNKVADRARFLQVYEVMATRERETVAMLPPVREAIAQLAGAWERKRLEAGSD